MRRFFIQAGSEIESVLAITGQDAKHIQSVLRLKPRDEIMLVDGSGNEYIARIDSFEANQVLVSILGKMTSQTESPLDITVAIGFLKEKKMDGLVRQLTELGMTRFLPYFAERSIPKPSPHRIEERIKRWERIAQESIKQCRRSNVPKIHFPVSFEQVLRMAENDDVKIVFWEKGVSLLSLSHNQSAQQDMRRAIVLLGPEGGLSESEVEQAKAAGFKVYSLGPRILRSETATITACTLVQFLLGDMGE